MQRRNVHILQALGYLPEDTQEPEPEADRPQAEGDDLAKARLAAAQAAGLPDGLADRLRGDDGPAILADARRLAESMKDPQVNAGEITALEIQAERNAAATRSIMPGTSWSSGKEFGT